MITSHFYDVLNCLDLHIDWIMFEGEHLSCHASGGAAPSSVIGPKIRDREFSVMVTPASTSDVVFKMRQISM